MADSLSQFNDVYAKWEKRGQASAQAFKHNLAAGIPTRRPPQMRNYGNVSRSRDRPRYTDLPPARTTIFDRYKTTPSVQPARGAVRPLMGRCCQCMSRSKAKLYEESYLAGGIKDILRVDEEKRSNPLLVRCFCHIIQVLRRNAKFKYPDVSVRILMSPRVMEAIQRSAMENSDSHETDEKTIAAHTKKAKKLIQKMKAKISCSLIRFTGWFLQKALGTLLSSLIVNKGQMDMIAKAAKEGVPVIYLPMHRSHLDYILVTFILFNYNIQAPHVAAGDNLLIPFFSSLMKGLGGYFIRRRLDVIPGQKDAVYRAILQSYMQELLRENQSFEFFIEGGRSRTGKPMIPKGGLLSVIVDAFKEGIISDAYIVPVSIAYERILDGTFNKEQMGEKKNPETFVRAVAGLWKAFRRSFGNVRVDFSQPFSLEDFLSVSQLYCQSRARSNSPPRSPCDQKPMGSASSLYGAEILFEEQRNAIKALAQHVIHTCMHSQAVMSTNLVSFLMLTLHRKGCSLSELSESIDWLREELGERGRDVGFTGEARDVALYACSVLGSHLVTINQAQSSDISSQEEGIVEVQPTVALPHVFELSYYASVTGTAFITDSVVVTACYALMGDQLLMPLPDEGISISKQKLLERAAELCEILQYEYTFCPPCSSIDVVLSEALERLTTRDIFMAEEYESGYSTRDREWADRLASTVEFNSDSDDDIPIPDQFLRVNIDVPEHRAYMEFLHSILAPLVESYWISACHLARLKTDQPEDDFLGELADHTKTRVKQGLAKYCESVSMDALKNSMKAYQTMKVTIIYYASNLRMIGLGDAYKDEYAVNAFIDKIEKFKTV